MPPSIIIRPRLLPPAHRLLSRQVFKISPFLLPCLYTQRQEQQQQQQQKRAASILSNLSDNPGAYNKKIRRGRGPSSGKGKTSGRGHKGQKQHGKVPFGFNGGQTKDEDTNPIRGLNNRTANFVVDMTPLNLDRVQNWINQGRIDPSRPITIRELGDSRCINPSKVGDGIKLLARGAADKISHPLNIVVSRASKAAISAVESAGGSVLTRYYTPFSIRRIMQGKTDPINSLQSQAPSATTTTTTTTTTAAAAAVMRMPRFTSSSSSSSAAAAAAADVVVEPRGESESESESVQEGRGEEEGMTGRKEEETGGVKKLVVWQNRLPDPVSRKAIEYYRDPAHRGYLSYQVGQGQGPSLFFKTPRPPPPAAGGVGGVGGEELAFASASNDSTSSTSATTSTKLKKKGQAAANRIW